MVRHDVARQGGKVIDKLMLSVQGRIISIAGDVASGVEPHGEQVNAVKVKVAKEFGIGSRRSLAKEYVMRMQLLFRSRSWRY